MIFDYLSINQQVYERGRTLANRHQSGYSNFGELNVDESPQNDESIFYVNAKAYGSKNYDLQLNIKYKNKSEEMNLEECYCSCPYVRKHHQICKHIVGLSLLIDEGFYNDYFLISDTLLDSEVDRLFAYYDHSFEKATSIGEYKIYPRINLSKSTIELKAKELVNDQEHIIKDAMGYANMMLESKMHTEHSTTFDVNNCLNYEEFKVILQLLAFVPNFRFDDSLILQILLSSEQAYIIPEYVKDEQFVQIKQFVFKNKYEIIQEEDGYSFKDKTDLSSLQLLDDHVYNLDLINDTLYLSSNSIDVDNLFSVVANKRKKLSPYAFDKVSKYLKENEIKNLELTGNYKLPKTTKPNIIIGLEEDYNKVYLETQLALENSKIMDETSQEYYHDSMQQYGYKVGKDSFAVEDNIFDFLEQVEDIFGDAVEDIIFDSSLEDLSIIKDPQVNIELNSNGLSALLEVKSEFSDEELIELGNQSNTKTIHRTSSGKLVDLTSKDMQDLLEILNKLQMGEDSISNGQMKVPSYKTMYLDSLISQTDFSFIKDNAIESLLNDFENSNNQSFELPKEVNAQLRDYQVEGYNYLRFVHKYKFGAILADDMGLGKTLQVITLLSAIENPNNKKHIVICPNSLVLNWKKEVQKFNPNISTYVYTGSKETRLVGLNEDYDLLLISYDLLKRDIEFIKDIEFCYAVLDEAQAIKNHTTLAAKSVKILNSEYRLCMTGTPIENNLTELWSIFEFLMPGYLLNKKKFGEVYEKAIIKYGSNDKLANLKMLVDPFILRRLKSEVLDDLPDKIEQVMTVVMDDKQRILYDKCNNEIQNFLSKQNDSELKKSKIELLSYITKLRQYCCNTSLVTKTKTNYSAKNDLLIELVNEIKESNNKVLIFSQFTSNFEYIEAMLTKKKISYFKLTGKTKQKERQEMVELFNNDDTTVFLISLKAGGSGLNITGASNVIHYDPWWNMSVENQATDRAHRIGQTKNVNVYKLVCENTIEDKIIKMQEEKNELANNILNNNDVDLKKMTKDDLINLFNVT